MSSACESCAHKDGCTSQSTCPSLNGPVKDPLANGSSVKTVIGIASGKGGVGKSFVTSVLAVGLARKGYKVGIMDADVTGPSIPQSFGLKDNLMANDEQIIEPAVTSTGIKAVSVNLLLENKEAPVIWRGPVLNSLVKQFWGQVNWGPLDVLLIDMPPGTGDVPLTVFQSIPLDGIVLVATSQDLVSMIVNKARNMASMMNVPVLGMVENMSFIKCPHCGDEIRLYGDGSSIEKSAKEIGSRVLDKLPLDPEVTKLVDSGNAEMVAEDLLSGAVEMAAGLISK
ncbi:MAG: Mrp/NBP35 family ATP-binding protein [Clostridiales bacterium]|nr:Mrp/NBP35 family ATP-binding protein [Clostridiales bacterium]MBR2821017.1 Mrp/NBP35 family ATP-binding protein [Clostridiales bacterium]